MKKLLSTFCCALLAFPLIFACSANASKNPTTLKEAFDGKFYIGAAVSNAMLAGKDSAGLRILEKHFNSIVGENCMKSMHIQPKEGEFDFTLSDKLVEIGERNNMFIVGHALIWHSQLPRWFLVDENGNDVTPEVLKQRMKNHISTLVGRYKGRVRGWDVVNEAIMENGEMRKNKFHQILGDEYVELAFRYAHEADPDAELYYNDYNEWYPGRRDAIVKMIKDFRAKGVRIDGVGMQGHVGMDYPPLDQYEEAIIAYAAAGAKVMITELELTILPMPDVNAGAEISTNFDYKKELNPYVDGVPEEKIQEWNNRFSDLFALFLKHRDKITRVTLWGINDGESWKNNFPVRGRTDYPLLFDRNFQPKPIVDIIIQKAQDIK